MSLPHYTLRRSQRKTLALTFDKEGGLVVRSPKNTPKKTIDSFVKKNLQWIEKHQQEILFQQNAKKSFDFSDDLFLPLLGKEYRIVTGDIPQVIGNTLALPVGNKEQRSAQYFALLKTVGEEFIPPLVKKYTQALGVTCQRITITSARTRWGSCSSRGNLCFSRFLFCLPPPLIHYVAAHEVSHLKEHNHSTSFYQVLKTILPEHKELQRILRDVQLPFL